MLNEIQGKYVGQRYIKEEKRSNKEKESCKKSRWENEKSMAWMIHTYCERISRHASERKVEINTY